MKDKIIELLNKIEDPHQRKFVESLSSYYEKKGSLTEAQLTYFNKINDQYSIESIEEQKLWFEEYKSNPEYQENAVYAAKYYQHLGSYYVDLSNKILNEQYVPTKLQYKRFCENKYAKRIIEESRKAPLFTGGDIIQVRKTCSIYSPIARGYLQNVKGMILQVSKDPIVETHVGARKYDVILFNMKQKIEMEERWLKKARGTKNKNGKK